MARKKLDLFRFVKLASLIFEARDLSTVANAEKAYKDELLDKLRYMQALSQESAKVPQGGDKSRYSAAMNELLMNLDFMEQFFTSRNTQFPMSGYSEAPGGTTMISAVDIIKRNKQAFIQAMTNGTEFVPAVWSKALETKAGSVLPPKYYASIPKAQMAPALGSSTAAQRNSGATIAPLSTERMPELNPHTTPPPAKPFPNAGRPQQPVQPKPSFWNRFK